MRACVDKNIIIIQKYFVSVFGTENIEKCGKNFVFDRLNKQITVETNVNTYGKEVI